MFLAAENPLRVYLQRIFAPDPFQGVYQLNAFDLLILLPYFAVLIILAFYGSHRYYLLYVYHRHRKKGTPEPVAPLSELPRVTVQLPVYNERYVVEGLIEETCRLEYPRELLEIQVLDDSTDDTAALARDCVERYAAMGHPIRYLHRDHREGYKAGALAEGLRAAAGEFIAIFDADFLPPADFLQKTLPHFAEAQVGMVQTRWAYVNRNYSWLTEVQAILLDGHFVFEHGARSRSGCFFNFNGTAGIWRRRAIEEAGGWQHDTLTEDTDLSYRAQMRGWKFIYLPDVECLSELPVDMNAFKTQQARWAKGLIQTGRKLLPTLWRSPLPRRVKMEAFFHLTANISYPLMVLFAALILPAIIVRFYQGWFQMLYVDLPLMIAATGSVSTFYLSSQRVLFPRDWRRSVRFLPFILATGIGLTLTNACAVLEALFGGQSEFVRTPKYRIEGRAEAGKRRFFANVYRRRRAPWLAALEIGIGCYFAFTVYFTLSNENYATAVFLSLFAVGYLGAGLCSLLQRAWDRMTYVLSNQWAALVRPFSKNLQES
jgi:cellulose synthase/poly-beta-1,6-N-acetylglucosamine synthase-like glycosyltransferase